MPTALALRDQIRPLLDAATLAQLAAPPRAVAAPPAAAPAGTETLDGTRRAPWWRGCAAARRHGLDRLRRRYAGAQKLARDMAATFTAAGWSVASIGPVGFALRPGLFVFIADEPSPTTDAVSEALNAGGLTTGWRPATANTATTASAPTPTGTASSSPRARSSPSSSAALPREAESRAMD